MDKATYTIQELVKVAATFFKQKGALVAAALQSTGGKVFTLDDAKLIVDNFARHSVKS